MHTPRLSTWLAVVLALTAFGRAATAQITLEADQPAYEVTQQLTVKITAPPGAHVFLLVDVLPGPVNFPIGELKIGFSPVWFGIDLGIMPASGVISAHEAFSCRTAYTYGTEVYLQAICGFNGVKTLSNGLHLAEMPGDCTDECTASVVEIGLQVTLDDVPASGSLFVNAWKGGADATQNYGPPIDIMFNVADVATGILPEPISNSTGSLVVSMLELNGNDLTIRFFVNAQAAGFPSLQETTYFAISYDSSKTLAGTRTDCSVPIKVGDEFGKFTVIKIIDGG